MNMKKVLVTIICMTTIYLSFSQNHSTRDKDIFDKYIKEFANKGMLPTSQLITETALFFLETPYVAHTLEKEPEALTVNLGQLDCTTFVETVLALSRTIKSGNHTFERFMEYLQSIRYRDGVIEDYSSRIHYTSEWISVNEKKGILENTTSANGGVPVKFDLNIISSNPDRYKQLKNNPLLTAKIKQSEARASGYPHSYIRKQDIEKNRSGFQNGDIIGFVTSVKGVDVSHMAFIYFQKTKESPEGRLTFIHASSGEMKVVVEKLTLEQYANKSKSNKGIITARAIF